MQARRRRCSLLATHFLDQRVSSRGTSCSSGCPPATTARAHNSDTSRSRSLRNSKSTSQASSSSTPCAPAGCCTSRDRRSCTCTRPPRAHTRSCNNSMPERHSRPPTPRSPGTPRTRTQPPRKTCRSGRACTRSPPPVNKHRLDSSHTRLPLPVNKHRRGSSYKRSRCSRLSKPSMFLLRTACKSHCPSRFCRFRRRRQYTNLHQDR